MKFWLQIETASRNAFLDLTAQVGQCVQESGVQEGICVVFVPHASAGLSVYEH
jgi:thiamine phosphate synthase YjbQ (UPF0047 family)